MVKMSKTEMKKHISHIPTKISKEMEQYATDVVLADSRYIFTRRSKARKQYGYCTHCKKEYPTDGLKHNQRTECRKCGSMCTVKASGISRKYLIDDGYFLWYEKSVKCPNSITARGLYVSRDYRGDYKKVNTEFSVTAMYLFQPGFSIMFDRYWGGEWFERKSVISEAGTSMQNIRCFYSEKNIAQTVKDTPFQYSTWEEYRNNDRLKFFDLAAKYPCVEYLTKLGLKYFVTAKIYGNKTYGAINWRGRNITEVTKLNKQQLKEFQSEKADYALTLRLFQISKKDKSNIPVTELDEIVRQYADDFESLKKILKHTTLRRANAYLHKQFNKPGIKKYLSDLSQVLIHWRDYISDCTKLEMDLNQESILFPANLYEAHQKTSRLVEVKADEILNAKIAKRAKALEKYSFENEEFFIRPALSANEIIEEGKVLRHCVGGYVDKYAAGSTNLFVIRKVKQPNAPFFTMEVKKDRIIQTHGIKHKLPEGKVKEFVDAFEDAKLKKKARKGQEVAV